MLCGGHGRSLKSKLFVTGAFRFGSRSASWVLRGPSMVANSPGAKAIIVEDMVMPPHASVAVIPWKFA